MKDYLQLRVPSDIYIEDIVTAIAESPIDLIQFIEKLDQEASDEGFTLTLIQRLVEIMEREYTQSMQLYTQRLLEDNFLPDEVSASFTKGSRTAAELEDVSLRQETMSQILKLLSTLEY